MSRGPGSTAAGLITASLLPMPRTVKRQTPPPHTPRRGLTKASDQATALAPYGTGAVTAPTLSRARRRTSLPMPDALGGPK